MADEIVRCSYCVQADGFMPMLQRAEARAIPRIHFRRRLRGPQEPGARLTNAFSKKVENHAAAVALWFMYYNFCNGGRSQRSCLDNRGADRPVALADRSHRCWLLVVH